MTHRTTGTAVRLLATSLLLPLLGGCFHETYTYRAVPNVNVARSQDLGSSGPLVLVSLDDKPATPTEQPRRRTAAEMIDSLNAEQIGRFDARMAELNRDATVAYQNLQQARSRSDGGDDPKVKEAQRASEKANRAVEAHVREFKANNRNKVTGMPGAMTTAAPPSQSEPPQTVLVGNVRRDFGERGSSVSRTFVLFIDGAPRPGTYWMTSDNSVLITYSAWSGPARTRVGLDGSVKILKVEGNQIQAHVALRETTEADSSEWVAHYYDPAYWQTPWTINGKHTFTITTKDDPAFKHAAIHWVKVDADQTASGE